MTINIITNHDDLGGMVYPFMPLAGDWKLVTEPLPSPDNPEPDFYVDDKLLLTLRWVKDDKVLSLHTPMNTKMFLNYKALNLDMKKGAFVLSKRLGRLMRPYRYWSFIPKDKVSMEHSHELDAGTWDGAGLISRALVDCIGEDSPHLSPSHQRELKHTRRFEITVMHNGGQEKGHVIVVDDLAVDLLFPAGSTKTEITMSGITANASSVFIGLDPIHHHDDMRLDPQSLINLHPFFSSEQLMAWLHLESEMFLDNIRTGELDRMIGRLGYFDTANDVEMFRRWWLGDYLLSGGRLTWFPHTVKAMCRQHMNRLNSGRTRSRFPIAGGRYYILPDDVGDCKVPSGQVKIDPAHATAWVNGDDWNDYIVEVLGGCDGDDALWVYQFTDKADGERKVLLWRSPNQLGEYIVLTPAEDCHTISWQTLHGAVEWSPADSRLLPPRIDTCQHTYGELNRFDLSHDTYSIAAMDEAAVYAGMNKSALGAYVNVLMTCKALYGKLPTDLPARLEDVIDGSVKDMRDMSPVMDWITFACNRIVETGKPLPEALYGRIVQSLTEENRKRVVFTNDHWLDVLLEQFDNHLSLYQTDVDCLADEAQVPLALFETSLAHRQEGVMLYQQYHALLKSHRSDYAHVLEMAKRALVEMSFGIEERQRKIVQGMACHIYEHGYADRLLWQDGFAELMLAGLRDIGLIGEPIWTEVGAVRFYEQAEPCPTMTRFELNGVWFNWLQVQKQHTFDRMGSVPQHLRQLAKGKVDQWAKSDVFAGRHLETHVADDDRIVTYTELGNLFGYVAKAHELKATVAQRWRIIRATAHDGNLTVLALPA